MPLFFVEILTVPGFSSDFVTPVFFSSPEDPPSASIAGRMSGASSRRACPVFLIAFASPTSYHLPSAFSIFKNLPGGFIVRMSFTMPAAMWAFSSFFVVGARYAFFLLRIKSRNFTFPTWLLMRPPRPHRTSLTFGSSIGPMPFGGTFSTGRGCAVDFLVGVLPVVGALVSLLLLLLLFQSDSTTMAAACRLCRLRLYIMIVGTA